MKRRTFRRWCAFYGGVARLAMVAFASGLAAAFTGLIIGFLPLCILGALLAAWALGMSDVARNISAVVEVA